MRVGRSARFWESSSEFDESRDYRSRWSSLATTMEQKNLRQLFRLMLAKSLLLSQPRRSMARTYPFPTTTDALLTAWVRPSPRKNLKITVISCPGISTS